MTALQIARILRQFSQEEMQEVTNGMEKMLNRPPAKGIKVRRAWLFANRNKPHNDRIV
jgi:hypothetical protein